MSRDTHRGFVAWILMIVGFILALVLVGFFTRSVKNAYYPDTTLAGTESPEVVSNPTPVTPTVPTVICGLIVETPLADATVASPLVIQGYSNGCGWDVVNGHLATVQLFSNANVPITTAIPVSLIGATTGPSIAFFTTLVYPDTASALGGYLLFTHEGGNLTERVSIKY